MDKQDENTHTLDSKFKNRIKKLCSTPMKKIAYLLEKWLFWANVNRVIVENPDALKLSNAPSTSYLSGHWSHIDSPVVHDAFRHYDIEDPELIFGGNLKIFYPILSQYGHVIERKNTIKQLNQTTNKFSNLLIKGHRLLMYPGESPKSGRSWDGLHQEFSDFPAICIGRACEYKVKDKVEDEINTKVEDGVNSKVCLFSINYDPYTPEENLLQYRLKFNKKILNRISESIEWVLVMVPIIMERPNTHIKFDNPVSFAELVEISKLLPDKVEDGINAEVEFDSLAYEKQYPILKNKEKDFEEIRKQYNSKSDEEKSEFFKEIRKNYMSLSGMDKVSLRRKFTSYLTYRERKLFMPNRLDLLCASIKVSKNGEEYEIKDIVEKMLQLRQTLDNSGYDTSLIPDISDFMEKFKDDYVVKIEGNKTRVKNKDLLEYHANRILSLPLHYDKGNFVN